MYIKLVLRSRSKFGLANQISGFTIGLVKRNALGMEKNCITYGDTCLVALHVSYVWYALICDVMLCVVTWYANNIIGINEMSC